jgi:hypothetical protein
MDTFVWTYWFHFGTGSCNIVNFNVVINSDWAMNGCNALSDIQHIAYSERFEMDHANLDPMVLVGTFGPPCTVQYGGRGGGSTSDAVLMHGHVVVMNSKYSDPGATWEFFCTKIPQKIRSQFPILHTSIPGSCFILNSERPPISTLFNSLYR